MTKNIPQNLFSGRTTAFCITRLQNLRTGQTLLRLTAGIAHRLVGYHPYTAVEPHGEYAPGQAEETVSSALSPLIIPPIMTFYLFTHEYFQYLLTPFQPFFYKHHLHNYAH